MSRKEKNLKIKSGIERSIEIEDVLGKPPNWLIKWSITAFFILLLVLLFICYLIKYPEVINTRILFTTVNPPAILVAKASGKISNLLIKENENVIKDQVLLLIDNPLTLENYFALKNQIHKIKNEIKSTSNIEEIRATKLDSPFGELQEDYNAFFKSYKDYLLFAKLNYHHNKIAAINQQINNYVRFKKNVSKQKTLSEEDLQLIAKKYNTDTMLYKEKVISNQDLDESKSFFLAKRQSLEQVKSNIVNAEIEITSLNQQILDHRFQYEQDKKQLESNFEIALNQLSNQLVLWEQHFLIKAPMDGKVSFFKFWAINQNVVAGEEVLTIISKGNNKIITKAALPLKNSGKVKKGQKVYIKLDGYPHKEYGMLVGRVNSISKIPKEKFYLVNVALTNGLNTNYHKKLEFKTEMEGDAEIITEDISLLQRIFYQFKDLYSKNI